MVSIIAEEIYSQQKTATFDDNDKVHQVINNDYNFTSQNIDTELGGFTYLESILISWEWLDTLEFDDNNSGQPTIVNVVPRLDFDNTVNLLSSLSQTEIFSITKPPSFGFGFASGTFTEAITVDTYADTPADFSIDFQAPEENNITANGTQSIEIKLSAILIGRQP